jgi:predicted aconitase with swiveling domain
MVTMIIRGHKVNGGMAEGQAIVSRMPFSFLGDFDPGTGMVLPEGHDLRGQSISGKVFVFQVGRGSTVGPNIAYAAKRRGNAPKAIVCVEAEPVMAMVAIMNDIPMMAGLDEEVLDIIRSGDEVRVDADTGTIEVVKPGR